MITLTGAAHEYLLRRAETKPKEEVCGMVWQHTSGFQTVWRLQNVSSQPDRYYTIDPAELKRAYESMDAAEATLLAFYHSHPGGKPDPSEADMEGALNVGVHYLIAYPEAGEWRLSAWDCIDMGILVSDELEVLA